MDTATQEPASRRAIDLCTCGDGFSTYHAFGRCFRVKDGKFCECPRYIPHPQPSEASKDPSENSEGV